jgi:hypothetical protein
VLVGFMPLFIISGSWPLLIRVPLCAAGALAGYICTLEFQGLPLYEHLLWTARGLYRLRVHGNHVGPEDLPGAIPAPDQDRVIVVSGPIEIVQRDDPAGQRTLWLSDVTPPSIIEAAVVEEPTPDIDETVLERS